jgi:hypothetical protein
MVKRPDRGVADFRWLRPASLNKPQINITTTFHVAMHMNHHSLVMGSFGLASEFLMAFVPIAVSPVAKA